MKQTGIIVLCFTLVFTGMLSRQTNSEEIGEIKNAAWHWIDANRRTFEEAALVIHNYAETRLTEYKSSAYLADLLEKGGFRVNRGVADLPTAFVASFGSGKPVVGILAEYDALPGLSQEPGNPVRVPVAENGPGHGCGHNLFGSGSIAAAMAVKNVMNDNDISGTIILFGCPAEEGTIGKVYMAKAGIFDGLDACFTWHPSGSNRVNLGSSLAKNEFEVIFRGKTAHAAADPQNGRSALDAAELMNMGVNVLREHVSDDVRIHYVYKDGGMAPNIVPEYARLWYYVRASNRKGVETVYARVLKCAEGAAIMTGTEYEIRLITGVYDFLPNRVLSRILFDNLTLVGPPVFSDEDTAFARTLQRNLGVPETGFATDISPFEQPRRGGSGSTDAADVSRIVPTGGELSVVTMPPGTPGHSWAVTASSGSKAGMTGMFTAAKVLAASALDVLLKPDIVSEARREFEEATAGFTYKSAIPDGQNPPIPE